MTRVATAYRSTSQSDHKVASYDPVDRMAMGTGSELVTVHCCPVVL
jgi:hypothetical protein